MLMGTIGQMKVNAKQLRDKLEIEREKEETRQRLRELCRSGDAISLHEILVKSYNEVDSMDTSGLTPLACAIIARHPTVVTELLLGYANPNITTPRTGMTSLHYAARWGDAQVLHELIRARGWIDAGDKDEWTPLHHCSVNDHFDAADLLTFMLADVHIKDTHGRTALDLAQTSKMTKLIAKMVNVPKDILKKSCQTHTTKLSEKAGSIDFRCGVVLEVPADVIREDLPVSCRRITAECFRMIYTENEESFLNDVIEFYPRRVRFRRPVTVLVDYDTIILSKEDIVVTCASKVVTEFSLTSQGKSTTVTFETKKLGRIKILKMKLSDYYESASQSTSVVDFESLRSEQQSRATVLSTWDESEADDMETRLKPEIKTDDVKVDTNCLLKEEKRRSKSPDDSEKRRRSADISRAEPDGHDVTEIEANHKTRNLDETTGIHETKNGDKMVDGYLGDKENPENAVVTNSVENKKGGDSKENTESRNISSKPERSSIEIDEESKSGFDEIHESLSQKSWHSSNKSVPDECPDKHFINTSSGMYAADDAADDDKVPYQKSESSHGSEIEEELEGVHDNDSNNILDNDNNNNDNDNGVEEDCKSINSRSAIPSELFSDSEISVANTVEIREDLNDISKELAEIEEQLQDDHEEEYIYT